VTVGILALHYVTSDPTEKQLGMKQPVQSRPVSTVQSRPVSTVQSRPISTVQSRPISTVQSRTGHNLPFNVAPQATTETRVCAGDHDADQDVITFPNRISVRRTYDVQFEEAPLPSINTMSIDRKHLAVEVEEVGP